MTEHETEIAQAYSDWGVDFVARGWTPYLMTFLFRDLAGSETGVFRQMEQEVERVYATHLTRVLRKPTAPCSRGRHPVWLCSPDRPVYKRAKESRRNVIINDGRHMHAVAFDPPRSRLREDLVAHFVAHQDLYVRRATPLICLDVEPVTRNIGYVVRYGRKGALQGRGADDCSFVLPRSLKEMPGRARS